MNNEELDAVAMTLLDSSERGNVQQVQALLAGNVPVNRVVEGWNALSIASARGHEAVVDLLLASGADAQGAPERPSLQCAASGGHAAVIRKLLAAGGRTRRRRWRVCQPP